VLLLRREFWEYRGPFLKTPLAFGAIAALFGLITVIAVLLNAEPPDVLLDGNNASTADDVFGFLGDLSLRGGIALALVAQSFVVYFYSLRCLYDDRHDRSILFWKSMPISDTQMVLSKAAWALTLIYLIAVPIGIAIGLVFLLLLLPLSVFQTGSNSLAMLLHTHPLTVIWEFLQLLAVQILWSFPTVGWLMFCSARSQRDPLLGAVLTPILGCSLLSFMEIFPQVSIPHAPIWYTIVYRGLLSIMPGSWILKIHDQLPDVTTATGFEEFCRRAGWLILKEGDLWIGVLVGFALIFAAILLRKRNHEI
jgi:ABC-2 type transport system permease protein